MKNKFNFKKILLVLLLTMILTGCSSEKTSKDFLEVVNDLKSYKITGKLTTMFPTGTKESLVTSYYLSPDCFRVEITNDINNDKQIIIKNRDGVYVLVPSVNKTFEIKSTWPTNSSYPYLLQSLSKDIISDDTKTVTEDDDSVIIEVKMKMFEDANPTSEKIILNKETCLPKEVLIYDDNNNLFIKFVVTSIETDIELSSDLFSKDATVAKIRSDFEELDENYIRSITYPTYYPANTKLDEEIIKGTVDNRLAIMKFNGDATYTIVQEYIYDEDTLSTEYIDGITCMLGGNVIIYGNDNITFINEGVKYIVASSDVTYLEMIKMADSLLVSDFK